MIDIVIEEGIPLPPPPTPGRFRKRYCCKIALEVDNTEALPRNATTIGVSRSPSFHLMSELIEKLAESIERPKSRIPGKDQRHQWRNPRPKSQVNRTGRSAKAPLFIRFMSLWSTANEKQRLVFRWAINNHVDVPPGTLFSPFFEDWHKASLAERAKCQKAIRTHGRNAKDKLVTPSMADATCPERGLSVMDPA
jgi:hypothetical protein